MEPEPKLRIAPRLRQSAELGVSGRSQGQLDEFKPVKPGNKLLLPNNEHSTG